MDECKVVGVKNGHCLDISVQTDDTWERRYELICHLSIVGRADRHTSGKSTDTGPTMRHQPKGRRGRSAKDSPYDVNGGVVKLQLSSCLDK